VSHIENGRSSPRGPRRLIDWVVFVLVVLAIGPAIGGFLVGTFLSAAPLIFQYGVFQWSALSLAIGFSVSYSYNVGEPIAALALAIFILLVHLFSKRSFWLAILSALLSVTIFWLLQSLSVGPFLFAWSFQYVLFLYVVSVLACVICWRMAKPLLNLY
jgi:hypothetical protein